MISGIFLAEFPLIYAEIIERMGSPILYGPNLSGMPVWGYE